MAFSVLAIFRNESHVLSEWIQHYFWQGADHIFLIDNLSSDDWKQLPILKDYEHRISLFCEKQKHRQVAAYNEVLQSGLITTEWLLVCDLDEFIYARNKYSDIKKFLNDPTLQTAASIRIPWKMFGSSGHISQPSGPVRDNYTHRKLVRNKQLINCKHISRTKYIQELYIHRPLLSKGRVLRPDGTEIEDSDFTYVSEELLAGDHLHLNHYAIQSLEYFTSVKMTRGDASSQAGDKVRNLEYFKAYDYKDTIDDELSIRTGLKS